MPPASRPSASIFWACASRSSSSTRSVMSRRGRLHPDGPAVLLDQPARDLEDALLAARARAAPWCMRPDRRSPSSSTRSRARASSRLREEALHVLTDDLVCGEADRLEERVVRGRDPPARIGHDDQLAGVLEQVAIAPLAGAQRLLEIALASYVAADAEDDRDLSTLVADQHRGRLDRPRAAVGVARRPVQETGSPAAIERSVAARRVEIRGVEELAHRAADKVVRLVAERRLLARRDEQELSVEVDERDQLDRVLDDGAVDLLLLVRAGHVADVDDVAGRRRGSRARRTPPRARAAPEGGRRPRTCPRRGTRPGLANGSRSSSGASSAIGMPTSSSTGRARSFPIVGFAATMRASSSRTRTPSRVCSNTAVRRARSTT